MSKPIITAHALEELKKDLNQQIDEFVDKGEHSLAMGIIRALSTIVDYQIYPAEEPEKLVDNRHNLP